MKSRSATLPGAWGWGDFQRLLQLDSSAKKSFPPSFIRPLIIENEAKTTEDKKQKKGPFVRAAPFLCSQRLRWPLSGVRWVSAANITQALCTGGIRFHRAFVLFFGHDQRATPALLPPIVPPTFPSLLGARGLFCLSPRGFSLPPFSLSFPLLFSFFPSFFLPAEGLKAVKVAGWHWVTGAGGAPGWPAGYQPCKRWEIQLPRPLLLPLLFLRFLRFTPPSSPLVNTSSPPCQPLFLLCHLPFLPIVHSL